MQAYCCSPRKCPCCSKVRTKLIIKKQQTHYRGVSHQSMYYRVGERARNNIRPQTKYARSQRHPVSSAITTDLGAFQLPLTTHHSPGTEVLARRLIGTCTQMQLIKKSSHKPRGHAQDLGTGGPAIPLARTTRWDYPICEDLPHVSNYEI